MSEKIFAVLLRLYPSGFRETYGDEAFQLFRDRARDEVGLFAKVRLWMDLFADMAVCYRYPRPVRLAAFPSFQILERDSPDPFSVLMGGAVSLALVGMLWLPGGRKPVIQLSQVVVAGAQSADVGRRERVVEKAARNLKEFYFDKEMASKMADALLAHEENGDDNAAVDGPALAQLLTKQMRDVSHDLNLVVVYSKDPRAGPPAPSAESMARYRKAAEDNHCFIGKPEIRANRVGYLKLDSFPDPTVCRAAAVAAMEAVNRVDALIFDLRDNGGGYPDMVALIGAYLFDHPEYLFNPREKTTENSWTKSPVAGSKLADKPVYVLTSGRTASGAEQFTYDLKMLKRATIVGETTRGSSHSGVFRGIDEHYWMAIPEAGAINPFGKTAWEGVGIEPDVKVKADDALVEVEKLLEAKLSMSSIQAQSPTFDVASIKASAPGQFGSAFGGLHRGTFHASNVSLRRVLAAAYGFSEARVVGPDWLDRIRFDMLAKSPPGVPDSQVKPMLQSLLKERFRLAAHLEVREMDVYNLVIAKGGVKMPVHPARDWGPEHPNDDRNIRGFPMMRGSLTTSQLADMIARVVNRPVIDRTGLTERYSIFLSYAPMSPQTIDKIQDFGPPDIFIALQEQLGLKLEKGKDRLDVAIIDHIEPVPTEN